MIGYVIDCDLKVRRCRLRHHRKGREALVSRSGPRRGAEMESGALRRFRY